MNERPILFSVETVRAILDGRKTQTRRVVRPEIACDFDPPRGKEDVEAGYPLYETRDGEIIPALDLCPYGKPGERLWVRETWAMGNTRFVFKSEFSEDLIPNFSWRPSIHMPRLASRITLEITGVRVERVQEISEADAKAEGATINGLGGCYRGAFNCLWDSINAKRGFSWASNPWVWVIEFKRVQP